jgi:hypothetical protein
VLRRFPHDRLSVKEKLQHIKLEKTIRNNIWHILYIMKLFLHTLMEINNDKTNN